MDRIEDGRGMLIYVSHELQDDITLPFTYPQQNVPYGIVQFCKMITHTEGRKKTIGQTVIQ